MLFFLIALVLAALGIGAYAYANTGVHDIALNLRDYHITGVPDWVPVAVPTGVVLFLFLLQAIYSSVRIRMLRRSTDRSRPVSAQRPVPPINR